MALSRTELEYYTCVPRELRKLNETLTKLVTILTKGRES